VGLAHLFVTLGHRRLKKRLFRRICGRVSRR
jgi:hypothetical protein